MPVDPQFKLETLNTVRSLGESFTDPDDDWIPILVTKEKVMPVEFRNEDEKDLVANVMAMFISVTGAKEYGFVCSAWTVKIEVPEELRGASKQEQRDHAEQNVTKPSNHPDRREVVVVSFGSSDGTTEAWMAEITRYEDRPPELGEWDHYHGDDWEGRFVTPLMEAVKRNA